MDVWMCPRLLPARDGGYDISVQSSCTGGTASAAVAVGTRASPSSSSSPAVVGVGVGAVFVATGVGVLRQLSPTPPQ